MIADLVAPYWSPGKMGRPSTVDRRAVLDAIFYVAATGCQWRALPERYPNWNTVHRLHLRWSRDGTWEAIADRLRERVRVAEGREAEPSGTVVKVLGANAWDEFVPFLDYSPKLYIASVTQQRDHADARTYIARKTSEGKTGREARRAHKRSLANRLIRRMWRDESRRQGRPHTCAA